MSLRGLSPRFWVAVVLVAFVVLVGLVGPLIVSTNPDATVGGLYEEPRCCGPLILGADNEGQSVIANFVYGTRTSLIVGLLAGLIGTAIGLLVGLVAGYRGGWLDDVLSAIVNVGLAIPALVIVILVSVSLPQRNLYTLALVIGFVGWFWVARAVRAQASSIRTREHIDVAKLSGAGFWSILRRDVLPYLLSYVVMAGVLQISSAILFESTLSMLGLGASGTTSLGTMLYWAIQWGSVRTGAWWAFIPPTLMLTLIVFSLLLLQSSLNEVFNPRLRRGRAARKKAAKEGTELETRDRSRRCRTRRHRRHVGDAGFSRTWGVALMGTLVNAENIRGVYYTEGKDVIAVNDVSIKIEEGEVLGLAGESGSGKTTLGSIISLIARPPLHVEHGTLEIDGKVQELGGHAKIPRTWRGAVVSMLPQGAMNSVSPTKRIRHLIYDVMRSHDSKISKDEALDRAKERLTTLGLPARVLDAYPHQLSGGMKQRTVTIISTLLNPRLLVADEPTSALDVTSQKILIEMLLEMLEKRIMSGVIFVTHDLPVLRTAANRIAVMYEGRIIELGPTEIMVERPEHPYTQALMSSVLAPEPAYANTRIEGMSTFDRSLFDAPAVIH